MSELELFAWVLYWLVLAYSVFMSISCGLEAYRSIRNWKVKKDLTHE